MYLKKLIIEGFKSFAQRTEFDFADGVTAIVGPNGSGKSNVSDALRWVMGEASARELRGAKMEDVIFSGTAVDRAVNFAQVSLVLDNSQRVFPIDYPEVTVTRRVFKSGESEYEVNKKSCRLKDISELFMDTGLGKGGYSVVGQGRIENILSTKSEERRSIFESAAGISKYKHRKEEAERKIVQIEDNLSRAHDIVLEIESRIEPLHEQSEKAKQYLALRDTLKDNEINVMLRVIDENRQKAAEKEQEAQSLAGQIASGKEEIEKRDALVDTLYREIAQMEEKNADITQKVAELSQQKTVLISGIELSENNSANIQQNIDSWEKELSELENRKNEAQHSEEQMVQKLTELIDKKNETEKKRRVLSDSLAETKESVQNKQRQAEENKTAILELMRQIAEEKAKDTGADMLTKGFADRRESLSVEKEQKSQQYDTAKAAYEQHASAHDEVKAEYQKKAAVYEQEKGAFDAKKAQLAEKQRRLGQKEQDYNRASAQAKLLADMREEGDGYPKAVKAVLKAKKQGALSGILDSVGSAIRVEEQYVTAVETALSGAVNHIIVKSEEEGKAAIAYLKKHDIGRATFLPLTSVKANRLALLDTLQKEEGVVAVASDLVKSDKTYHGIVENLLGRTLVMDTMDHAVALSRRQGYRFRIVTLDGGVCNVGGSLTGGSSHYKSSVLSGGVYLEKTQRLADRLQAEIAAERETIDSEAQHLAEQEQTLYKEGQNLRESLAALSEQEHALSSENMQLTYLKQALNNAQHEWDSIAVHIKEADEQKLSVQQTAAALRKEQEKKEEQTTALQREIAEQTKQADEYFREETRLTIELSDQQKDCEVCRGDIARCHTEKEDASRRLGQKQAAIAAAEDSLEKELAGRHEKENKLQKIEQEIEKTQNRRVDFGGEKEKRTASIEETKKAMAALRETNEQLIEKKNSAQETAARLSAGFDTAVERLWEEYELSYSDANLLRHEVNLTAAKKAVKDSREAIRDLGSVNVDAIEEYRATKERYDFLTGQITDLTTSKQDLHQLIVSMQRIMKEQFEESFALINENFSVVFQELFGGGTASLSLEDPSDVLSSNIVIHVQPPGKKLQNINLMSGGEKALSAISLLFAILRMKPTPFCILDEIDAPLDEVNVDGFADYLHQYSHNTQFIMITHRQGTMVRADEIYGVTMQRRGISTVLKMAINKEQER